MVEIVTIVALVGGLLFAGFEWRASRRVRRRQSQILLLRSFDSPEFLKAMRRLLALPDGAARPEIDALLGEDGLDLLWFWLGSMESIGIHVFNREIDLRLVEQSFGAPVTVIWRKLRQYVESVRAEVGSESMHEWYQWIVERVEALPQHETRSPAHVRHASWQHK